jgi:gliding motility-associated-like protein
MPFFTFKPLKKALLLIVLLLLAFRSEATHIFGLDLYYVWVSGNTYNVRLVVYGDCSGGAFPSLATASPQINIYNGGTFISTLNLVGQAPTAGVEVTPVCPSKLDSTTCTNLAFPYSGVKKFVYAANVTVSGPSPVWRFLFQGVMGGSSSAGRSGSITNIISGSIVQLVDTLNNTTFNNSSAVYTTIPTPFYCIDVPANFTPGAVDPNGDSLVYRLVPGIDATSGVSVSYIPPYTALAPLGTTPGSFSFNAATGQLSFTPNILQKALVVYNVEEFSGGVLRGTSQREMTVVVISPCTNTPPNGFITTPSAGTVTGGGTTITLCQSVGPFSFHVNPTDPDGNHITMTASGLPAGSTFNIVNNGTFTPLGTFSWSTTGVAPGNYIFFINYKDDGCPLSGERTIAYTITVLPVPTEVYAPVSAATCVAKALFHVTPGGSASPWVLSVIQGGVTIQTIPGVTGMVTDSLVPGVYTIRMTNPSGCYADTIITIGAPLLPLPAVVTTPPLCPGASSGTATITGSAGLAPYQYALGSGAYGSSGSFTGLAPGSYVLHIKDANNCVKDTTVIVPDAAHILLGFNIHKPLCNSFINGSVIINPYNSTAPYTYSMGGGPFTSNDTFASLGAGVYTFHVKNANGCQVDTTLTLVDSVILHATLVIAPILCNAGGGTISIIGSGGFGPPYSYAYDANPFGGVNSFTLPAGTYTMHIKDPNSCFFDTSLTLTQPTAITTAIADTNIHCNGAATGIIAILAAGGTPAYQYNVDAGTYGGSAALTGLSAGVHVVTVMDANGCIHTNTVTLTQPSAIHIDSVIKHQPLCNGGADGSLSIYASGGVPPYAYATGTGAYSTSSLLSALTTGVYLLHVIDANGCIKDTSVTLGQPAAIILSAIVKKSFCGTLANGKVTLSGAGGTPGYSYAISGGPYTPAFIFTPLAAGAYLFHIKDANLCVRDTTIVISDSLTLSAAITITPALCNGQASGMIDVTGAGGVSPYTYALGSGTFTATHLFTTLLSGGYGIHVRDINGCQFDTLIAVGQPSFIVPDITVTPPSCFGLNDGVISISAVGGTPAYAYSYNNGAFSATFVYTTVHAGTDSVRVRDANGCVHDTVFTVAQPDRIAFASVFATNVSCFGGNDGTIAITGAGGTPPYLYALDALPWQAGSIFPSLAAGAKLVKLKDSRGCEIDTNATITQPDKLIFTALDSLNPTCLGFKDGTVSLHVAGGTWPYTYSSDNATFISSGSFPLLPAGAASFYVRDANGCNIDTSATLVGLPQIIIDSTIITRALCHGGKNGAITLGASGGSQPLTYKFNNSGIKTATAVYKDLSAGAYPIVIADSRNCTIDTVLTVSQPDSLGITDFVTPNECSGQVIIGAIIDSVWGGTGPYAYMWSYDHSLITPGVSGLQNGQYTMSVTDANKCAATLTSEVKYNDCCTPYLPNAFTPNGDGKNDIYRFRFTGDMFIVRFSVYNRFGQEVYTLKGTSDLDQGWDGKLLGVPAEMGVYYYYAKIICGRNGDHVKELKGDVTLVR